MCLRYCFNARAGSPDASPSKGDVTKREYSWSGPDSLVHDLSARGVRRALTNAPPLAVDAIVAEDADDFVDTLSPVRRARTDLPPLAPSGWSEDLESRLEQCGEPPVRVAFTRELSDARALNRWRATALAMARASQLLKRTDSRVAGCIERAHDAERAGSSPPVASGREEGAALLETRLASLRLRTVRMGDDGNCQFRALAHGLFGDQEDHQRVRDTCVEHMRRRRGEYEVFFGDAFDEYASSMASARTWGDELTLRACSDAFQCVIHVVQSTAENWYLVYEPQTEEGDGRESRRRKRLFLTYVSPVHYNSFTREGDN